MLLCDGIFFCGLFMNVLLLYISIYFSLKLEMLWESLRPVWVAYSQPFLEVHLQKLFEKSHWHQKKTYIHLKGHHQYFLQDHSPNFQGATNKIPIPGVEQWWFRRIRGGGGAGNSGFKIHCFDSNSAFNVLGASTGSCWRWMVFFKFIWKGHLFRIPVPFGKCVRKPFQLGQGEICSWEAFESPPWGWNNCLDFLGGHCPEQGWYWGWQAWKELMWGEKGVNLMEYQSIKIYKDHGWSTYPPP